MRTAHWIVFILLFSTECYAQSERSIHVSATDSLRPHFSLLLPDNIISSLQKKSLVENAKEYLSLYYIHDGDTADLSIAMSYRLRGHHLTAVPYYDLGEASTFVLRWRDGAAGRVMSAGYVTPSLKAGKKTTVLQVFPGGDTLPHNLLFFQIRFSAPMMPDPAAFSHVSIQADTPGSVPIPFAWRQRSFWTDSNRLLVLMIHPGRVKTGIRYAGPLLFQGVKYVMSIDSALMDSYGQPLMFKNVKRFVACSEDRDLPVFISITGIVKAGTQDPLTIRFSEPMDLVGITEGITVSGNGNNSVATVTQAIDSKGTTFAIRPIRPWQPGTYTARLSARVVDLAANTLHRPFEMTSVADQQKDLLIDKRHFSAR